MSWVVKTDRGYLSKNGFTSKLSEARFFVERHNAYAYTHRLAGGTQLIYRLSPLVVRALQCGLKVQLHLADDQVLFQQIRTAVHEQMGDTPYNVNYVVSGLKGHRIEYDMVVIATKLINGEDVVLPVAKKDLNALQESWAEEIRQRMSKATLTVSQGRGDSAVPSAVRQYLSGINIFVIAKEPDDWKQRFADEMASIQPRYEVYETP